MSTENTAPDTLQPAKVIINDETPLDTAEFRDHPVFLAADPEHTVPDVTLASGPLNPLDRPYRNEERVGVMHEGQLIGAFNLAQLPGGMTWIRDVKLIERVRGKRFAVAAYLGVIAAAHDVGRRVQSDPQGLIYSPDGRAPARQVWESLVRRGAAEVIPGEQDAHGNPRFISRPPAAT